jgi:transposase InsO family protein
MRAQKKQFHDHLRAPAPRDVAVRLLRLGEVRFLDEGPAPRAERVEDALSMAITLRSERPEKVIFHTDRGTQYASDQITTFANENGPARSMSSTGVCWGNAMAERFFATLKTEFYYRRVWPTKKLAHVKAGEWIKGRNNHRRRHASLGQVPSVALG